MPLENLPWWVLLAVAFVFGFVAEWLLALFFWRAHSGKSAGTLRQQLDEKDAEIRKLRDQLKSQR